MGRIRWILTVATLAAGLTLLPQPAHADDQPRDVSTRGCPRPTSSPLPTVLCLYLAEFKLPLRQPAVVRQACVYFYESIPLPSCTPGWTATAYIGDQVYRVYLSTDGRFSSSVLPAKRPLGEFRTLTVWVDYGSLNIQQAMATFWPQSVARVNARHATFAQSLGYAAPLVRFVNQSMVIARNSIAATRVDREVLFQYLKDHGIRTGDYDVVTALDLDPAHGEGGYSGYGSDFIHMGWYFGPSRPIDQGSSDCIASSVYHHEMGHIWGWEHLWTADETNALTANCDAFLTDPALFGWTDTDGDRVPEIADPTPYGLSRLRLPLVSADR